MHKISMATGFAQTCTPEAFEAFVLELKEAGFDGLDFSFNIFSGNRLDPRFYRRSPEELIAFFTPYKEILKKHGFSVSQSHSLFPTYKPDDDEYNAYAIEATEKIIALCAFLDCPSTVIHGIKDPTIISAEEQRARNMAFYPLFIESAKKQGVKLLLENLYVTRDGNRTAAFCSSPESAIDMIDSLNALAGEKLFGLCYDVGHANICALPQERTLSLLGDRVWALHIHDTDKNEDHHTLPFTQLLNGRTPVTDWKGFTAGLRAIGYRGWINFEAQSAFSIFPQPTLPSLLSLFRAIGEHFSREISGTES